MNKAQTIFIFLVLSLSLLAFNVTAQVLPGSTYTFTSDIKMSAGYQPTALAANPLRSVISPTLTVTANMRNATPVRLNCRSLPGGIRCAFFPTNGGAENPVCNFQTSTVCKRNLVFMISRGTSIGTHHMPIDLMGTDPQAPQPNVINSISQHWLLVSGDILSSVTLDPASVTARKGTNKMGKISLSLLPNETYDTNAFLWANLPTGVTDFYTNQTRPICNIVQDPRTRIKGCHTDYGLKIGINARTGRYPKIFAYAGNGSVTQLRNRNGRLDTPISSIEQQPQYPPKFAQLILTVN